MEKKEPAMKARPGWNESFQKTLTGKSEMEKKEPAMKARPGWNESFQKTLTGNVSGQAVPFDPASNLDQDPAPVKSKAKTKAKAKAAAPAMKASAPAAKPDQYADLRADLLANKRADDAARAAAERKRKEAEAFSANLKSTTRKGGNKAGYDAYKSLMGE